MNCNSLNNMNIPEHEKKLIEERFQQLIEVFACLTLFIYTVYLTYSKRQTQVFTNLPYPQH